jgi:hypothetical protein
VSPLTDVLRAAAERYREDLEARFANLATENDRQRFLIAARKILVHDPQVNNLSANKRRALLAGPIDTDQRRQNLVEWLARAVLNLIEQYREGAAQVGSAKLEQHELGVLSAQLVAAGLELFGPLDRSALANVALALREQDDLMRANVERERGKVGRQQTLSAQKPADVQLHKAIVRELRTLKNQKLSNRAKMTAIRPLIYKGTPQGKWKSVDALTKFASRRHCF